MNSFDELEAQFSYTFEVNNRGIPVYFAMSFPFTFTDLQKSLEILDDKYSNHESVYYKRELLTNSYEGNRIDMLTITSHTKCTTQYEQKVHPNLFPNHSDDASSTKR